jgi:hypothetical protein
MFRFQSRSNLKANEDKGVAHSPIPNPDDKQPELLRQVRVRSAARVDARTAIFAEVCGIPNMARIMVFLSRLNQYSAEHVFCVLE